MTRLILTVAAFMTSAGVTAAHAADYCGVTMDQRNSAPAGLAGAWAGKVRSGMMVGPDGKPQAMTADEEDGLEIMIKADGTGLSMEEAYDFFPAVALTAFTVEVMSEPDFALPGESPLGAAELLAPEVLTAGLSCNAKDLPQFVADVPMDDAASATFRLFALTPDQLVLVIKGEGGGKTARAVFDLDRRTEN